MALEPFKHHFWSFNIFKLSGANIAFLVKFVFFCSTKNKLVNPSNVVPVIWFNKKHNLYPPKGAAIAEPVWGPNGSTVIIKGVRSNFRKKRILSVILRQKVSSTIGYTSVFLVEQKNQHFQQRMRYEPQKV